MTKHGGSDGHGRTWSDTEQGHYTVVLGRSPPAQTHTNGAVSSHPKPRFPHIKDLQARADPGQGLNPHTPIRTLLEQAQQSASQANASISFGKPDRAYIEYLRSSNILLEIIPRHKDYPMLKSDREGWRMTYTSLCKQNDKQHHMFKTIYDMIVEDNKKCGTKCAVQLPAENLSRDSNDRLRPVANPSPRPLSMPPTPTSGLDITDELFLPPPPPYSSSPQSPPSALPSRPIIHPKPKALQGRPATITGAVNGGLTDALAERFTQLRMPRKDITTNPQQSGSATCNGTYVDIPSPTDYGKPAGPRGMPPPPNHPPPPPKIPLGLPVETALPRAPSPAYDPSKSVTSPQSFTNRRGQVDGPLAHQHIQTGSSKMNGLQAEAHSVRVLSGPPRSSPSSRPPSADYSAPTSINAERLFDILREHNILLIDVRSRQEFDFGHIFAKSIMCVEPVGLRSGLSAEELEETLVVSPPAELELFERRNEFEYVIYYDQHTASNSFLTGPPDRSTSFAMRALHDTIHEFNYYKPLQRPPLMLRGGLDAWVDLIGNGGLAQSKTAALIGSTRQRGPVLKPGRPIGRVPVASHNSSLEVRRRRLREHTPLNPDEERSWLERARNEEVDSADYQHAQSDGDEEADRPAEEPPSPFVRSYEEFLQTFPEVSSIPQSMTVPLPPPPTRPAPAMPLAMPSIPSRPPPAAPRPSYSGVSDRSASALSPISRRSVQPPLYTSRTIMHYLKLPRTGLVNFGVTCYTNATIQCLLATIPLSQFFLDNRWRDFTVKNWKGSNGIMPEIYANLIRSLWKGDVQSVRPVTLRKLSARLNPEWGLDRQQDAKEYLDFLLDCLHEDLNQRWEKQPLAPLSLREEITRESMPIQEVSKIEWDRYSHRESSFISNLFAGQHASRLRCTTCKNTSTTYEAFYSISVEIPPPQPGAKKTTTPAPDIHDCLRSYCQEERLGADEMWKCPHCKCQRAATKQIIITRAPQFLVVHFKRFSAGRNEGPKKVHTPIDFPLHGLNIETYMAPPPPSSFSSSNNNNNNNNNRKNQHHELLPTAADDAAVTPPFVYDAYAVMRHLGVSGTGGHYIGLVRDAARGCWRKFDDDRVSDFDPHRLRSEQRLQNEQAYL
ncbi:MAG: hypothetical protein L6R35_003518, partial [Caloplaca aegaea]